MKTSETSYKIVRRRLITSGMLSAMLVLTGFGAANAQSPNAGFHVTICHRTGSASNPYIIISPDAQGVVSGHLDHEQTCNGLGGDIVPLFTLDGVTYSKNLSTSFGSGIIGAQVLANGCVVPGISTPTPTPTPPPGSTPPPAPVPEPMTIVLFGIGLAGIGIAAARKFFS